MSLDAFLAELDRLVLEATGGFKAAADPAALEAARIDFLGAKSGRFKAAQKGLGSVPPADKPAAGKRFNEIKTAIEAAFARLASDSSKPAQPRAGPIGRRQPAGHPLGAGPSPPDHADDRRTQRHHGPARFLGGRGARDRGRVAQFRGPEHSRRPSGPRSPGEFLSAGDGRPRHAGSVRRHRRRTREPAAAPQPDQHGADSRDGKDAPPVRIISLGRVYRPDTADATHYPMFHQIEGLLIDAHVTMADLKSVLRLFAASYLGADVHIRFRPSFFPFTEPSVEVDMSWHDSGAASAGSRWAGPEWSIPTCCGRSVTIPEKSRASPSAWGSNGFVPAGTASATFASFIKTTSASCGNSRFSRSQRAHAKARSTGSSDRSVHARLLGLAETIRAARHVAPSQLTRSADDGRAESRSDRAGGPGLAINLEVTSNRPDCLGHIGIAREISVLWIGRSTCRQRRPRGQDARHRADRRRARCPELCYRYTARVIRGVKVGPSPAWLVNRLATIGIAAINNVVDVTNYVLMECGQPLHAFDLAGLNGRRIVVREARKGETSWPSTTKPTP